VERGAGVKIWDVATGEVETRGYAADGPLALGADGRAIQLSPAANRGSLLLWDVMARRVVRSFPLPIEAGSRLRAWSLSPDGSCAGAAVERVEGAQRLLIWDAASGRLRHELAYPAADLAFAPEASLLAAWDDSGHLDVWTVSQGKRVA